MTPAQYEQRCAEMLRANAHNMSPSEVERMAYGAGDLATCMLAAQMCEVEIASRELPDDSWENIVEAARMFLR